MWFVIVECDLDPDPDPDEDRNLESRASPRVRED